MLNNLLEHILYISCFLYGLSVTCDRRLPEHYRWASPTSWPLAGLRKPDKPKSREKNFGNRWLQARFCSLRATHPRAAIKGWISVCYFSIQVIIYRRIYTGFLSCSCSSEFSWRVVFKSALQNHDARPEKRQTNVFLLLKLVHLLKTYLVKCPQLVQIASAFRRKEVWKFILEWESPIMKYWMLLIFFL